MNLFRREWARVTFRRDEGGYTRSVYAAAYWGMLINSASLWIGAHWRSHNKRLCLNLIPCVTLWITLPGGNTP